MSERTSERTSERASVWTSGLNPEQREAVLATSGPLLILAGAGSGKTTVLVSRTGQILSHEDISAKQVCVLTFTNKAAKELKQRVLNRLGTGASDLATGTFHSFGLKILRKYAKDVGLAHGFGVIDQGDSQEILKELASHIKNSAKDSFRVDRLLGIINDWRATGRKTARNESDEYEVMAQVLLPKYLKRLESLGVVDFEALILKPLELMQENPRVREELQNLFRFIMVDEFQDTNTSQFQLVIGLSQTSKNIAVVGDDDQSIYGWRGAKVENILTFPRHFPGCRVIRLERNYRSTPSILKLANHVIEKNQTRHGKILRADPSAESGTKPEIFVYENDELECEEVVTQIRYFRDQGYRNQDIAVLFRANSQGGMIEAELRRAQIPYNISGGTGFFDRKEIKDALAYLRCSLSPNEVSFRRVLNTPARGIGDSTIDKLSQHAEQIGCRFHVATRSWRKADIAEPIGSKIEEFFAILDQLPKRILTLNGERSVGTQFLEQLRAIGYRDAIAKTCKDSQAVDKKWAILEIFCRVLDAFVAKGARDEQTLQEFVDAMELRDPGTEVEGEGKEDKVQLLTLHACKGLEFPVVLFVGCEEDLIPHRTLGSDVSEERRLFYVGITRAKERLVLSRARTRKRFGRIAPSAPSRFLLEISPDLINVFETGFRPVAESERKNLLSDLFKKLENTAEKQKIVP